MNRTDWKRRMPRFFADFVLLVVLLAAAAGLPLSAYAEEGSASGSTVVVACSDFQYPNWDAYGLGATGNNGGAILARKVSSKLVEAGISSADGLLVAGDYDIDLNRTAADTGDGIRALRGALTGSGLIDSDTHCVFVQGNHDPANTGGGTARTGNNDPASGAYGVYVMNERDYSWYGGTEAQVKATAADLKDYISDKLDARFRGPVFVITHLPLHYSMRTWREGDARYAKYIYDVLNAGAAHGLKIIYLFGHDHSQGWDDYLGAAKVFLRPGDRINIADGTRTGYTVETLKFVYMNAGYMGYYNNHNTQTSYMNDPVLDIEDLSMSSFVISDSSVVISRYNSGGPTVLKKAGVLNRYRQEDTLQNYAPNTEVISGPYTFALGGTVTSHVAETVKGKPALCTETGLTDGVKCSVCGLILTEQEEIPAKGHAYGSWKTVKQPTYDAEGLQERVCANDASHKETKTIAKKTRPETEAESPAEPIRAEAVKTSRKTITVQWNAVKGATGYIVYGSPCGRNKKLKKLAAVTGTSYTHKKLKKGTYYKYYVEAVKSGSVLSKSRVIHAVTKGGKYGNPVKLTPGKNKIVLKTGQTLRIKTKIKGNKKVKKHCAVYYESDNEQVAQVTNSGTVKGVGKGSCRISIYAQNGLMKSVTVTVR